MTGRGLCRAGAVALAVVAGLLASRDRVVRVELAPAPYAASVERFTASQRDVLVDAAHPDASVPYVLPGPADRWAGSVPHALRVRLPLARPGGIRLDLHVLEAHEAAPPRLAIDAGGATVHLVIRPGTGLPPPHVSRGIRQKHTVVLPDAGGLPPVVTIVNEAGSWLAWERITVRDAGPTVAWANLARPGRLPPGSAALLLAALALTLAAAAYGVRDETPGRLLGSAVALGLVGPLAVLGGDTGVPVPPRWLTLALPWLFLAAHAVLARRTRRVRRAWAAAVLDAVCALFMLHVGLILFTGGYAVPVAGITLTGSTLALPAIGALALAAAGIVARHGTGRPVLVRHAGVLLFVLLAVVYLANGRSMGFFDTRGARYLPLSILREGDFDLDEFRPVLGDVLPAYVRVVNGRHVSGYPVGAALVALPLYVPAALGDLHPESPVAAHLEKLCAALLIALSATFLYLAAVRLTSPGMAALVALAYGLGTSSLSTSSQALWQHAAAQPALAAALYALVRARSEPRWVAGAGFALAFAIVARPVNVLLALPLGVYAVRQHPRAVAGLLLGALPPLAFQGWYDLTYFGGLGHSRLPAGYTPWDADIWSTPLWSGLAGVLASPARGLLGARCDSRSPRPTRGRPPGSPIRAAMASWSSAGTGRGRPTRPSTPAGCPSARIPSRARRRRSTCSPRRRASPAPTRSRSASRAPTARSPATGSRRSSGRCASSSDPLLR